jgi:Family of unknown function (DUF6788)
MSEGTAMRVPSHPTLVRRMLERRLKQLAPTGPVLAASLVLLNKRCGQPSCRCHHGGPLHQAYHITFREGGKTKTAYVPKDLLTEVQEWMQEHRRLKALLREVNLLSLALIRGHVQHRRRQQGRH